MLKQRKASLEAAFSRRVSDEQHGAYGGIRCHGFGIDGWGPDASQLFVHRRRLVFSRSDPDPATENTRDKRGLGPYFPPLERLIEAVHIFFAH
jgi:hypothetical protein